MKKIGLLLVILLIGVLLFACAPKVTPVAPLEEKPVQIALPLAKEGWEAEWKKTLALARKEGRIAIYTFMGGELRNALSSAFKEKYDIPIEFVAGPAAALSQRIFSERRAGIFLSDLYIGGSNTIFSQLKPAGMFEPLDVTLILPEVKNPQMWWDKKLPFLDKEGKYVFSYGVSVNQRPGLINYKVVKEEEVASYMDLLSPKWKDQIVINDPTTAGRGLKWLSVGLSSAVLNRQYFEALVKQEPIITRDLRIPVEWVAQGKKLLAIAPTTDPRRQFQRAGATIKEIAFKEDVPYFTSTGAANILLMNQAPHPNAAIIFINWLLSKEGQTSWSRSILFASLRTDVPTDHLEAEDIPDKNIKYLIADGPDFLKIQEDYQKLATEIFSPLLIR